MPRTTRARLKYPEGIKRRDGQLYMVLQRKRARWLFPGATVDLSVKDGQLIIQGLSDPDRPKRPKTR